MTISSVGGQGLLSARELWAAVQGSTDSSGARAGAFDETAKREIIDEFDADGDGTLSDEELEALQEKLDAMGGMMAMMHRMRMGQDGEGGAGAASGSSDSTEEADLDGDGVVTFAEWMEYAGMSTESSSSREGSMSSLLRRAMAGYAASYGEREERTGQGTLALLGQRSGGPTAVA